jgi:hypothetical protein
MIKLHPREKNANGVQVIELPKEEFLALQEMAEDYQDLLDLEQARHENAGDLGIPYEAFRKQLGL